MNSPRVGHRSESCGPGCAEQKCVSATMRRGPGEGLEVTLQRSHACPVREYDRKRFLTTVEKCGTAARSMRGSFILPVEPGTEGSSPPAPSSAARLGLPAPPPAGYPAMATVCEDEAIPVALGVGLVGGVGAGARPNGVPAWRPRGVE